MDLEDAGRLIRDFASLIIGIFISVTIVTLVSYYAIELVKYIIN